MKIVTIKSRFMFLLILPVVLFFVLGFNACLSPAKGQYSNLRCEPGMGLTDGEMDFGINLKVNIKNVGKDGDIQIFAEVSSSEGEWKREQTLRFKEGESRELTYFFEKPTINVDQKSIECRIALLPSAK